MSDDLISRQAAINSLREQIVNRPLDSDRYVIRQSIERISGLPSAQKIGEWLAYPTDWSYDEGTGWKCSLCGNVTYEQNFDYCPYCGARMDE